MSIEQDDSHFSNQAPIVGALSLAVVKKWNDKDQDKVNRFIEEWIRMIHDELREKEATLLEIMARIDLQDDQISKRVESKEYQSLVRKTFREWAGAESEAKRVWIRNILSNSATSSHTSDEVVRMFIDWIGSYSELHFKVIANIYQSGGRGTSRGAIWRALGRPDVREDSADADLYKLLFRDLSTGGIMRQHREVDYEGNFLQKATIKKSPSGGAKKLTSAFDNVELYELTELGAQFVHYAMNDLPLKVEYQYTPNNQNKDGEEK